MIKRLFLLFAFLALVIVPSCKQDKDHAVTPDEGLQEISFELDASEFLKNTINNGTVTWATKDTLSVFDDESQFLRKFGNTSGKKTSAIFKGEARLTSQYKVLYPYHKNTSCSGDVITYGSSLLANQNLPANGGFATSVPAAGKVNITGNSTLTDLTALLKFTVPTGQTTITRVRIDANEYMTGKFKVNLSSTPVIQPYSTRYTYVQTSLKSLNAGTFYLAVFPGTYTGLTVTVNDVDVRTISGSKTFAAGKIYDLGEITYTGPGDSRDITVTFLPAETSTKASSGIPWVTPSSSTTVAYCTNTDAGFTTAEVTVNSDGKLQFTAPGLAKNTKQLWMVYPAQDNAGKNWASKTLTVPTAQTSNTTGDFVLDNYPFAIKVPVGQSDTLDFTYSLNGSAGDSREESNATIVKFDLGNSLYGATGYAEKFSGVTCGSYTTTFNGTNQYALTAAYVAMAKTASASYAFTLNRPYQAGYTYPSQTINTSSGNIMTFEPQCTSRIVCVRSGDNIQTRLDACKPYKAYSKVSNNDEMRIASGTFNLASTINPRENINVAGGYTATTVAPFTSQGGNQLTILDGQSARRCIDMPDAFTSSTTWSNMKFQNGSSGLGGGLKINGTFTLSNCYVYNCVSQKYQGGGIYSIGATTITGCTIDNCSVTAGDASTTTENHGGGVFITGACTFSNNTITNCTAAVSGGGIYVAASSGATLTGGSVSGNTAAKRGGVCLISSGGTITSCNIYNNSATAGDGGGLFLASGCRATSCNIYGNTASANGGGVSGYGTGKLKNCSVYSNTAGTIGGGVYWTAGATVNANVIEGGTVGGDTAAKKNTATGNGGGVYIAAAGVQAKISGATIKYNKSDGEGGGIYADSGSKVTITSCTVDHNTAGGDGFWGGGIYCKGGTVSSTIISYNSAGAGAGLYALGGSISDLTVYNNTTSAAWDSSKPTYSSGGGMYLNGCGVSGTMLVHDNVANGRGGGAFLKGTMEWSGDANTKIYNNNAYQAGGLWLDASTVTVHGSRRSGSTNNHIKIYSNTATSNAGGAYIKGAMYCADIYSNTSGNNGGGCYIYRVIGDSVTDYTNNYATLYNSTIYDNTAASNAGGVYLYGPAYMVYCKINGNKSSSTSRVGLGVTIYHQGDDFNNCAQVLCCSVCQNSCTGATQDTNSAGIYITCSANNKYGYLYNVLSWNTGANYDITTSGNVDSGRIYGCAFRKDKVKYVGTTLSTFDNKAITAGQSTVFVSTTAAGVDAFRVKNGNLATYLTTTSTLPVNTYFSRFKYDYWGNSISGDIGKIGCQSAEMSN